MLATNLCYFSAFDTGKSWFEMCLSGEIAFPENEPQYEIGNLIENEIVMSPSIVSSPYSSPNPRCSHIRRMEDDHPLSIVPASPNEEDKEVMLISEEEYKNSVKKRISEQQGSNHAVKRYSTQSVNSPTKAQIMEKAAKLIEEEEEITECCVCFSKENLMISKCKHLCCRPCWMAWLNKSKSCPLCREKTNARSIKKFRSEIPKQKPRQKRNLVRISIPSLSSALI